MLKTVQGTVWDKEKYPALSSENRQVVGRQATGK